LSEAEKVMVGFSTILVLGIGAQWIASWLRIPSILLLLTFGFIAGPVAGVFDPDALFGDLLFPIVSVSVCLILFEGSLGLCFSDLRKIMGPLRNLLTIGVVVTWVCCAAAAYALLRLELSTSLLLGAILVVTGPTVVGPMLRHIRPTGVVGPIARWEGIVIDPIGAVLAVLVFEAIESAHAAGVQAAAWDAIEGLAKTVLIGLVVGGISAWVVAELLRRHWIDDHLQSPVTLMIVVAAFTGSNLFVHESGLFTVTLMGVLLANQAPILTKPVREFNENLSVLLISSLFILLAARVQLEDFSALGWRGPAFVAFTILAARPVAVFLSCVGSSLKLSERLFLAWLAPRGIVAAAVASLFALRMGESGRALVPATFLVIVGTVVVYGLTTSKLAIRLGLASANPQGLLIAGAHAGVRAIAHAVQSAGFPVLLVDTNRWNINAARLEGLPTCYANILSEHATEQLDLGGIGRFLALTRNDEVNSLASMHFTELFGRAGVYQLLPEREGKGRADTAAEHLRGRFLFGPSVTYRVLDERFAAGWVVKTTRLTGEFTFDDYQDMYGPEALVLFVKTEPGELVIRTAESTTPPRAGQTLIGLVPEKG
jgi:NhaP-type Na+/H+ or K+/H+ antiporter